MRRLTSPTRTRCVQNHDAWGGAPVAALARVPAAYEWSEDDCARCCVCVCVRASVRACVRACVRVCVCEGPAQNCRQMPCATLAGAAAACANAVVKFWRMRSRSCARTRAPPTACLSAHEIRCRRPSGAFSRRSKRRQSLCSSTMRATAPTLGPAVPSCPRQRSLWRSGSRPLRSSSTSILPGPSSAPRSACRTCKLPVRARRHLSSTSPAHARG